ncbi:MAG: hypothetical protein J3Q66DRAFT_194162 [Benniella sp.]|nr:MAG: hypothetical protein J3Q66DRAFT_194162 [Benniella sp.]
MRSNVQIACIHPGKRVCFMIQCPEKEPFSGAAFLSTDGIVIWTQSGGVYMYSIAELQQDTSLSPVEEPSSHPVELNSAEPRLAVSRKAAQVPLLKLDQGSLSSLFVFKALEGSYLLSLKHASEGLYCVGVKLQDAVTDSPPAGNEFVIHETPIRWSPDLDTSLPLPSVTCSLMLSDTLVALGRNCGQIWVTPLHESISALSSGFAFEASKDARVLRGHVGPITSMFTSDDLMQRSFLLSGGNDCSARIWNVE